MNCPKCGGKSWITANPRKTPFGVVRYRKCTQGCEGLFKTVIQPDGTEQLYLSKLPRRITAKKKECLPDGCQGFYQCKQIPAYEPVLCESLLDGE